MNEILQQIRNPDVQTGGNTMDNATIFQQIRNRPDVRVEHVNDKRTSTVELRKIDGGQLLASKTELLKRGKVATTLYIFP